MLLDWCDAAPVWQSVVQEELELELELKLELELVEMDA